jgi:hypothetical protein
MMPFEALETTTAAFGMKAPDESRTTPEMLAEPAVDWANAEQAARHNTSSRCGRNGIRA